MLSLGNIVNSNFSLGVLQGVYARSAATGNTWYGLTGSVADSGILSTQAILSNASYDTQQAAQNTAEAISTVQNFEDAAGQIETKLQQMQTIAQNAVDGSYTTEELQDAQAEFETLAEEINQLTEDTTYDDNALLTADGQTIEISIGNSSTIDITAKDLTFDAENIDLSAEPQAALSQVESALDKTTDYRDFLDTQGDRITQVSTVMDVKINSNSTSGYVNSTADAMQLAMFASSQIASSPLMALVSTFSFNAGMTQNLLFGSNNSYSWNSNTWT